MSILKESPDLPAALAGLPGTVLELRYELGRVLGAGGMGAVFEARHLRLDRRVAIKVLRPAFAGEGEYIERFLREAKAASKIRHRNVVEILDYGETGSGLVYSVMEFLVGQDLEQLLRAHPDGRLPWARACGLLVQIASGLKSAHGQGVIHRDIKPANCFLTDEDGEPLVKLVDFGIAKLEGSERGHTLTGTAQVLGTPSYIAPEMVRTQRPASPQSDIYALGVVAYRMLTGRVPFRAETVFELLRKACFDPVPSLRAQVPEVPAAVEALVLEMLAKELEQRPADMQTVRDRLVTLSRQTLGARAVEIPGSSALPLSVVDSVPPPGMTEDTTLPREAVDPVAAVGVALPDAGSPPVAMATEVVQVPAGFGARPAGVTGGARQQAVGDPQGPVHDPSSVPTASPSPSRSGETVPAVGESTLRGMEASGTIDRPRGRSGRWAVLGAVGVAAVAGALVMPAILGGEDETAEPAEAEVAALEVEPAGAEPAGVEPEGSGAATDGEHGEAVSTKLGVVAASGGSTVSTDMAPASDAAEHDDRVIEDPDDKDEVLVVEDADEAQGVAEAAVQPEPPARPKHTKPKRPPEPSGPPADSVLVKKLKRTVTKRCTGAATVKFLVTTSGGMMGLTATGPAGPCAKAQVQGTKFRTRSKSTPFKFTVE